MFKGLKTKLLSVVSPSDHTPGTVEIEVDVQASAEQTEVDEVTESVYQKTSNDFQQESIKLEPIGEEDFLDLRTTQSIQLEFKDVLAKLDQVTNLVEEQKVELSTLDKLKLDSKMIDSEVHSQSLIDDVNSVDILDLELLKKDASQIKRDSDTYQINEGMFELNSELHNAMLIIEDTNIPTAITKEQILNK